MAVSIARPRVCAYNFVGPVEDWTDSTPKSQWKLSRYIVEFALRP
jgi:hypothetical protein